MRILLVIILTGLPSLLLVFSVVAGAVLSGTEDWDYYDGFKYVDGLLCKITQVVAFCSCQFPLSLFTGTPSRF